MRNFRLQPDEVLQRNDLKYINGGTSIFLKEYDDCEANSNEYSVGDGCPCVYDSNCANMSNPNYLTDGGSPFISGSCVSGTCTL
ncbi:hypothetical protein KLA_13741 [Cellulophaga geojensis KL-A]|uniref:Bacteriocin n=1 Tax=Cellulophaga geojensis KL-A TaxID=1328323 RepID=A0ABN0RL10_9FLAO|nr:hypothetical protein [Cellulophaga geojensis]EWH12568.1 hypothetical protein KLA_13741 [Cellulophaga geojensis KL-A]